MTTLGSAGLIGAPTSPNSINNMGQVVGYAAEIGNASNALFFLDTASGEDIILNTSSALFGPDHINSYGMIVGGDYPNPTLNALWTSPVGAPVFINTLLPINSGWSANATSCINDLGVIIGSATLGNFLHGIALVPLPTMINVTGKLTGMPTNLTVMSAVMAAYSPPPAGSPSGSAVTLLAPAAVTPDGSGRYNFNAQLQMLPAANSSGSLCQPNPPITTLLVQYQDQDGNQGIIVAEAGALNGGTIPP